MRGLRDLCNARRSVAALAMGLWGCEVPITNACPSFTFERSIDTAPMDRIDLLLVIDDSSSMAEPQRRIADELAQVVRVLADGDLDGDGRRDVDGFEAVRVGVVRTSMNGGGAAGCLDVADVGALRSDSSRDGCPSTYPERVFVFAPSDTSADALSASVACVSAVGASGCGIEQPLEAMRAALETPGFHRDDAVLAVVIVTDEDDCSHDGVLAGASADPRLGCNGIETHPIERYVAALERAEPRRGQRVVSLIAGVPIGDWWPYDELLADPRMQEVIDEDALVPSCASAEGSALPPRRLVTWLAALHERNTDTSVSSICAPAFTPILYALLPRRASSLPGNGCLPRALPIDAEGRVRCQFEVLLPHEDDGLTPQTCEAAGFVGLGATRDAVSGGLRERCIVPQLLEAEVTPGERGWRYDDLSFDASMCESGARLGISGLEHFHQVTLSVRCEQPLPEGAPGCADGG